MATLLLLLLVVLTVLSPSHSISTPGHWFGPPIHDVGSIQILHARVVGASTHVSYDVISYHSSRGLPSQAVIVAVPALASEIFIPPAPSVWAGMLTDDIHNQFEKWLNPTREAETVVPSFQLRYPSWRYPLRTQESGSYDFTVASSLDELEKHLDRDGFNVHPETIEVLRKEHRTNALPHWSFVIFQMWDTEFDHPFVYMYPFPLDISRHIPTFHSRGKKEDDDSPFATTLYDAEEMPVYKIGDWNHEIFVFDNDYDTEMAYWYVGRRLQPAGILDDFDIFPQETVTRKWGQRLEEELNKWTHPAEKGFMLVFPPATRPYMNRIRISGEEWNGDIWIHGKNSHVSANKQEL